MSDIFIPEVAPSPDISDITIEDDTPVDNFFSEKQQRFLTEVLHATENLFNNRSFIVSANVGVFHTVGEPPLVPDVFLSLNVEMPQDWRQKKNRTYFIWEFGKSPEVVIEIVSNRQGNELGSKLRDYARMGVWYYIVYDPLQQLGQQTLYIYQLVVGRYLEMETPWLEGVGLGLTLWEGEYENKREIWLRWCDQQGQILPTGAELARQTEAQLTQTEAQLTQAEAQLTQAEAQLTQERQRAEQLAAQLRALGVDPETLS